MARTQNGCQYAEYDSLGLAVPALEGSQVWFSNYFRAGKEISQTS
jgi:hypothetical protein